MPGCTYLHVSEDPFSNILPPELAWQKIPKDYNEQILRGVSRGHPHEEAPHRLRYDEVRLAASAIQQPACSTMRWNWQHLPCCILLLVCPSMSLSKQGIHRATRLYM
eukprot:1160513-Pelagomonas_calceolata.AAC.10